MLAEVRQRAAAWKEIIAEKRFDVDERAVNGGTDLLGKGEG